MNGKYNRILIALVAVAVSVTTGGSAVPIDDAPTAAAVTDGSPGYHHVDGVVEGTPSETGERGAGSDGAGSGDGDTGSATKSDRAARPTCDPNGEADGVEVERVGERVSVEGDGFDYENDGERVEFETDDGLDLEVEEDGDTEIEGPGYDVEQRGADLDVESDGGSGVEVERVGERVSVEGDGFDYENDGERVEFETDDGLDVEIEEDGDVEIEGPGYDVEQRGADLDVERVAWCVS
ncbi:hypothetical protein [Halomarina pelagica]|uniref:hypothetical protein n=1 Tax=Halomarina pelagica TaxID=2961599 RepID=UPI0020C54973|nr:hypothetical protein [Halomarina sp. BND7]